MKRVEQFIDGQFETSASGAVFPTVEPSTGNQLGSVSLASEDDVDHAVCAARRAFDSGVWSEMPVSTRAAQLYEIASILEDRAAVIAEMETRDSGMTISMTRNGHVPRAIAHFRYFAEEAERLRGETYPIDGAYLNLVSREPVGVVAIFAPWNAPLAVASINVAAAIAFGNTCVLKPSEHTPLSANMLAEICLEAGLPPGVVNVVYGPGEPTGQALSQHPGVDVISFVGGTPTGRTIMANAARRLVRVGLELGGKSPVLVLEDADLEKALDGVLLSAFSSNGEVCTAASRILVQRPVYAGFVDALVERVHQIVIGDPLDPVTEMGPLISIDHLQSVESYIELGIREGAQLRCGGERPANAGFYLRPAIFAGAHNAMTIAREEIFGPVAAVIPFDSVNEGIAIANDTNFGLAAYVWSEDSRKVLAIARRLRAGNVAINSPLVRDIRAPFGGYRQSGIGRIGGNYSVDLFTEVKTTCIPINPYSFPRLGASGRSSEVEHEVRDADALA